MKNAEHWVATKFQLSGGKWLPSRDPKALAVASRVSATRAATSYAYAIERHARGHLADLGCGNVPFYGLYRSLVDEVTCIDWPGSFHANSHIDIFADLNQPLELPNGQFDTIILTSVLEHIWRHDVLWSEMARLLRTEGKIILGVPFCYRLHEEPFDFFRWTTHALQRACLDLNLKVVSIEAYGGPLDVMADIALRMLPLPSFLKKLAANSACALLSGGPLRKLSDRKSASMPLGYVLVAQKA